MSTTPPLDLDYLRLALTNLGSRRHGFILAACERRDQNVIDGDHVMAAVWQALAVTTAEILDDEHATLHDLERDFSPIIRPLTAEELAEVHFDDETPQDAA